MTLTRSPWGRPIGVWPSLDDFTAVGLSSSSAATALAGVRAGKSFEDACRHEVVFRGARVDEAAVRHRAGVFDGRMPVVEHSAKASVAGTGAMLHEEASPQRVRARLRESASKTEALLDVCLIDEGQGSSGMYSAATLRQAESDRVFDAGLHCYVDHPTSAEELERPVRSVQNLAGCLEVAATFKDQGLWSTVRVFSSHKAFIVERAAVIGLSIRASGDVEETAAGRVVTRLVSAESVDFVTRAGRGGRISAWRDA